MCAVSIKVLALGMVLLSSGADPLSWLLFLVFIIVPFSVAGSRSAARCADSSLTAAGRSLRVVPAPRLRPADPAQVADALTRVDDGHPERADLRLLTKHFLAVLERAGARATRSRCGCRRTPRCR